MQSVRREPLSWHEPVVLEAAGRALERIGSVVDGDRRNRRVRNEDFDRLVTARRARALGDDGGLRQRERFTVIGYVDDVESAVVRGIGEARGGDLLADLEAVRLKAPSGPVQRVRRGIDRKDAVVAELRLHNRRRVLRERPDQRFVDEVAWGIERNSRRAVVAEITIRKLGPIRVVVEARSRVSDIGFGQQMA